VRALPALLAAGLLLVGCTPETSGEPEVQSRAASGAPVAGEPSLQQALQEANLPPCPGSDAPAVGGGLPDLELDCLGEGEPMRLGAVRGPAVVNLWGSWCGPCREEVPVLEAVRQRAGERLAFLGVDVSDERVPALQAAAAWGMGWASVQDPDGDVKAALGVQGLPVTVFIDADGREAGRWIGEITSDEQLGELVSKHLGVTL
jgi:cytochrome c biogenesis protein CcmG/thiol:disulfide interchange protein DsbE